SRKAVRRRAALPPSTARTEICPSVSVPSGAEALTDHAARSPSGEIAVSWNPRTPCCASKACLTETRGDGPEDAARNVVRIRARCPNLLPPHPPLSPRRGEREIQVKSTQLDLTCVYSSRA